VLHVPRLRHVDRLRLSRRQLEIREYAGP
jgi:hypothetical protein